MTTTPAAALAAAPAPVFLPSMFGPVHLTAALSCALAAIAGGWSPVGCGYVSDGRELQLALYRQSQGEEAGPADHEPWIPQDQAPARFQRPDAAADIAHIGGKRQLDVPTAQQQRDRDDHRQYPARPQPPHGERLPPRNRGEHRTGREEPGHAPQPEHDEPDGTAGSKLASRRRGESQVPADGPEHMHCREDKAPQHGWPRGGPCSHSRVKRAASADGSLGNPPAVIKAR